MNDNPKQRSSTDGVDPNYYLTVTLALIGCCLLLKVRLDSVLHDARWFLVGETLAYMLLAMVCRVRPIRELNVNSKQAFAILFVCLPVFSFLLMRWFNLGEAFEILLMQLCQNVSLISIGLGSSRKSQKISVLFSFFLTIFVTTLSESPSVLALAIPYLVLGIWWLMVSHWSGLETYMPNKVESNFKVRSFAFFGTVLLLLAIIGIVGWQHEPILKTINGFMPTSGGKRNSDRFARSGVGDGDFFVAATNHASTVGPVESDLFLESSKPSLFDIVEENYNRAALPIKKKSERAFSPDDVELKHAKDQLVQSEQSGRTFRILRDAIEENRKVTEHRTQALFYLAGPVPIRLSLRYFDHFDGLDWSVSAAVSDSVRTQLDGSTIDGKTWFRFRPKPQPISRDKIGSSKPTHPFLQGYENHSIKIMRLDTNRILAPPMISGWHFDKCDDPSFFQWTSDGAIEFAGRDSIPELAIYHLVSQGVNYEKLRTSSSLKTVRSHSPYAQLENLEINSRVQSLARQLTHEAKTDWERVEAVVSHLRDEYRLENLLPQESSTDGARTGQMVIDRFLTEKKGPDYVFATVAALMLRSVGMETRLVNGFYVDEKDYDVYSDQSIVDSDNLHFWIEVRVNGEYWVTVEPSPGFASPRTRLTWRQRLATVFNLAVDWVKRHPFLLAGMLLAVVLAWVFRIRILLAAVFGLWLVERLGSRKRNVMATFRLARRRRALLRHADCAYSVSDLCIDYREINAAENGTARNELTDVFCQAVNHLLYDSQPNFDDVELLDRACWTIAFARPQFG